MLTTNQSYVTYQGNGVTTQFPYNFIVQNAGQMVVSITNNTVNLPATTVLGVSQYSATGIGVSGEFSGGGNTGGIVTYPTAGSPLPAGWSITIQRVVPYTQNTSLTNQGAFYPQVVEQCLDALTMQTQQLAAQMVGSVPASGSGGISQSSLGFVTPQAFGAYGDGVHDDTAAFQAACDTSRVVFVPAGTYLIAGQVNVAQGVLLIGASTHSTSNVGGVASGLGAGSILLITSTALSPFVYQSGCRFNGLTLYWPNQLITQTTPTAYPFAFTWSTTAAAAGAINGVGWEDIQFVNAYQGIDARPGNGHNTFEFKNISGCILFDGIEDDGSGDSDFFFNVRFHPYYFGIGAFTTHMLANATGITLGRADGFRMDHIFFNGTNIGLKTVLSNVFATTVPQGNIADIQFDGCNYGWYAEAGTIIADRVTGSCFVNDFYVPSGFANNAVYSLSNVHFDEGTQTNNVSLNSQLTMLINGGYIRNITAVGGTGAIVLGATNLAFTCSSVNFQGGTSVPIIVNATPIYLGLHGNYFDEGLTVNDVPAYYRYVGNANLPDMQSGLSPTPVPKTAGVQALSSGTATVTVPSGSAIAICTDTTALNPVKASISGTTLTITGTGSDVIAYAVY